MPSSVSSISVRNFASLRLPAQRPSVDLAGKYGTFHFEARVGPIIFAAAGAKRNPESILAEPPNCLEIGGYLTAEA
jgi:hypothetical protein